MTCYDILVQTGDKRAAGILHSAKAAMLSIAASIPDEADRQVFLHGIPLNRRIRQAR